MEDDSYLSSRSSPGHAYMNDLGMPSQDLLKNIHYAAARYYDERGLLVNATAKYRKERKIKKIRREDALGEAMFEDTSESQSSEATDSEPAAGATRKVNRDMYKVLDGTVLIAIGVLTQEIVSKFVGSKRRSEYAEELSSSSNEVDEADGPEDNLIEDLEEEDTELMH